MSVESLGFARTERTVQLKMWEQTPLDIPLRLGYLHDPLTIDIDGSVRLTDNTPADSVTIVVVSPFDQQIVATTRTNAAGQYAVPVDDPGQYLVYAFKSGFKVSTVPIILAATLPRERCTADFVLSAFKLR